MRDWITALLTLGASCSLQVLWKIAKGSIEYQNWSTIHIILFAMMVSLTFVGLVGRLVGAMEHEEER